MKVIRTEKIENYNKKITVNKNLNNNNMKNNYNINIYKQQRASSHSPSHKTNILNNK